MIAKIAGPLGDWRAWRRWKSSIYRAMRAGAWDKGNNGQEKASLKAAWVGTLLLS